MTATTLVLNIRIDSGELRLHRKAPELPAGVSWSFGLCFITGEVELSVHQVVVDCSGSACVIFDTYWARGFTREEAAKPFVAEEWRVVNFVFDGDV